MADAPNFAYTGAGIGQLFGAAAGVLGANAGIRAADANQDYLNKSADFDIFRGTLAQLDVDRQAKEVLDAQKVAYAAQNVDLSSESVAQVREETFYEAKRIKNLVELDAAMSAWGKREQGRLNRAAAREGAVGARIGAVGNVAAGVGSLAAGFA